MRFNTGNYTVEIDLKSSDLGLTQNQLSRFEEGISQIGSTDKGFQDICSLRDGILRYESETLLPACTDNEKQKVLIVLGNPAIHSVKKGMFFYSKMTGDSHQFWGKMVKAGLVPNVPKTTRDEEARLRRDMILSGDCSGKYLLGLTTFYSFPTPGAKVSFAGVAGVERLFKPFLQQIIEWETKRVLAYPFTDQAIIVFCQKSSCQAFSKEAEIEPVFWPLLFTGAGGDSLSELLENARPMSPFTIAPTSK